MIFLKFMVIPFLLSLSQNPGYTKLHLESICQCVIGYRGDRLARWHCSVRQAALFMAALANHAYGPESILPSTVITKTRKFASKVLKILSSNIVNYLLLDDHQKHQTQKQQSGDLKINPPDVEPGMLIQSGYEG